MKATLPKSRRGAETVRRVLNKLFGSTNFPICERSGWTFPVPIKETEKSFREDHCDAMERE